MRALVIANLSGPDALAIQDMPDPLVKEGQTLIRVRAGGLNFADFMTTKGGYPGTPPPPLIAGREFAGVEEGTGRRVMGYTQYSAFAEKTAAYSNLLWPVPEHWTDEQAAAFPVNFFTAYLGYWQAGMTASAVQPPMWGGIASAGAVLGGVGMAASGRPAEPSSSARPRVLIHAVAGGVGTAAVQIGRLLGVEMYGTSSSEEKLARVKALDLQHAINYKAHDYEEVVKNLTHGE